MSEEIIFYGKGHEKLRIDLSSQEVAIEKLATDIWRKLNCWVRAERNGKNHWFETESELKKFLIERKRF